MGQSFFFTGCASCPIGNRLLFGMSGSTGAALFSRELFF